MMPRTRSKFGVDITAKGKADRTCNDYITGNPIVFDSKLEKKFYEEVVIPGLEDGTIAKAELQKKYNLQPSFKHEGKESTTYNNSEVWMFDKSSELQEALNFYFYMRKKLKEKRM